MEALKTFTVKLPDGLLDWLKAEAKRTRRPSSVLVREILERHQGLQTGSALDLVSDLCGCVESGRVDLSRNKKYLRDFGSSKVR